MMYICSCLYMHVHVSLICANQENYHWGYWRFILCEWELHNLATLYHNLTWMFCAP